MQSQLIKQSQSFTRLLEWLTVILTHKVSVDSVLNHYKRT